MIDTKSSKCDIDKFLDTLIEELGLKNDAALARALEVLPPVISKLRHRKLPIGATMLLRAHELTGSHVREIRKWAESSVKA